METSLGNFMPDRNEGDKEVAKLALAQLEEAVHRLAAETGLCSLRGRAASQSTYAAAGRRLSTSEIASVSNKKAISLGRAVAAPACARAVEPARPTHRSLPSLQPARPTPRRAPRPVV